MGLIRRTLCSDEYHRLSGTELESVAPSLPPSARVLVVELDGEIVACWALMPVFHVEGVWIAPEHRRRVSVVRGLLEGMAELVSGSGVDRVVTAAASPEVRGMLDGLDAEKLDADFYTLSLKDWEREGRCLQL